MTRRSLRVLLCAAIASASPLVSVGCSSHPQLAAHEGVRTISLSVSGLDCADCFTKIADELKKDPGVYDVAFDRKRVIAAVVVGAEVLPASLLAAVERAGFSAEIGERGGSYLPNESFRVSDDVVFVVKDGADVDDLSSLAVVGKVTIVDLYARWCEPCRKIDAHVKSILGTRADVAYRKLDIVDWDTPLAKHQMKGVPDLPYVVVFGKDRAQIDAISGLDLVRLDAAISKAR